MRWDYTAPERKQFVSDGAKMYSYIPQDKQVIVSVGAARRPRPTTPTLFLAGKGSLTRDFTPSLVDAARGHAGREPGAEARAESAAAGLRLARPRRRSGDARHPRAW